MKRKRVCKEMKDVFVLDKRVVSLGNVVDRIELSKDSRDTIIVGKMNNSELAVYLDYFGVYKTDKFDLNYLNSLEKKKRRKSMIKYDDNERVIDLEDFNVYLFKFVNLDDVFIVSLVLRQGSMVNIRLFQNDTLRSTYDGTSDSKTCMSYFNNKFCYDLKETHSSFVYSVNGLYKVVLDFNETKIYLLENDVEIGGKKDCSILNTSYDELFHCNYFLSSEKVTEGKDYGDFNQFNLEDMHLEDQFSSDDENPKRKKIMKLKKLKKKRRRGTVSNKSIMFQVLEDNRKKNDNVALSSNAIYQLFLEYCDTASTSTVTSLLYKLFSRGLIKRKMKGKIFHYNL